MVGGQDCAGRAALAVGGWWPCYAARHCLCVWEHMQLRRPACAIPLWRPQKLPAYRPVLARLPLVFWGPELGD